MIKFMRLLMISGIVFLLVFVGNFVVPIIPNKVYSLEKKFAYNKILDGTASYLSKESVCCKIYYTDADSEYISLIANAVSLYYPLILDDFGIDINEIAKPVFVVFPDENALSSAIGFQSDAAPMGAYYGGVINVLSPGAWIKNSTESEAKDRFLKEGPLIHEMVHFAIDLKAGGNYPLWFTEGVALYYENKLTAFNWRPDLNDVSQHIAFEDLQNNFKDMDSGIAYRCAFNRISEFVGKYGEDSLQSLILKLGEGESFADFDIFFEYE